MYLSFLHCLFDRASGLVDMTASAETALSFTGREFREAVFQIFFLYISHIEGAEPRRIHDIGLPAQHDQLGVPCRMFSSLDLTADAPCLHLHPALEEIDQG